MPENTPKYPLNEFKTFDTVKIGSEREFGLVFTIVFLAISAFPLISGKPPFYLFIFVGILTGAVTMLAPKLFAWPNRLWFKFALLISKIMTPIIMAIIFVLTVIPMGLLLKLFRKDPLQRKYDMNAKSYWLDRKTDIQSSNSMKTQF